MSSGKRPRSPTSSANQTRSVAHRQRARNKAQSGGFGSASRATAGPSVPIRSREIVQTYRNVSSTVISTTHDLSDLNLGGAHETPVLNEGNDDLHWLDEGGADPFSDIAPDPVAPQVSKATKARRKGAYKVIFAPNLCRSPAHNTQGCYGSLHEARAISPSPGDHSTRWASSPRQRNLYRM
jgi:hypothetical protein